MNKSVRNVWAKFEVDPLSTWARQVFTTQKFFPNEILLIMKTAT